MKNYLLYLILVILALESNLAFGQSSLAMIGPRQYVSNFTLSRGRHCVDTIVVNPGTVFKIENAAMAEYVPAGTQSYFDFNHSYLIEIGQIFIQAQEWETSSTGMYLKQQSSFPMWIGPGVHFVHVNLPLISSTTNRLSIHGLLFSLQ